MRQNNIGAKLIAETWLEGDATDEEIGGYHIFRHNMMVGESGRDHLFKGVAIILSPEFHKAWKAASAPPPITTDINGPFGGRFISLKLKFPNIDKKGRTINGNLKLALVSVYHPCHDPQRST